MSYDDDEDGDDGFLACLFEKFRTSEATGEIRALCVLAQRYKVTERQSRSEYDDSEADTHTHTHTELVREE